MKNGIISMKGNFALEMISEPDYQYLTGAAMLRHRLRKSAMAKAVSTLVGCYDPEAETFVMCDDDDCDKCDGQIIRECAYIIRCTSSDDEACLEADVSKTLEFLQADTVVEGGTDSLAARLGSSLALDAVHKDKAALNLKYQQGGDGAVTFLVELVRNGSLPVEEPEYVHTYITKTQQKAGESAPVSNIQRIINDATVKLDQRWKYLDAEAKDKAIMGIKYIEEVKALYC
jgi:hypothetical protein